jgi:hypothetical protein
VVHVAGLGLRVELCWDTTGLEDLDVHVHRPNTTTPWFTADDCFHTNCKGVSNPHLDWGYDRSPLSECLAGPDGSAWQRLGGCINPRLDIDNIVIEGRPEDVNIDRPENDATYRVMANYFGTVDGPRVTRPMVNIYCQGHMIASYGQAPDRVDGFNEAGGDGGGSMWRVADVTTHVDANGVTTCDVQALHPAGQATGYDVRIGDESY